MPPISTIELHGLNPGSYCCIFPQLITTSTWLTGLAHLGQGSLDPRWGFWSIGARDSSSIGGRFRPPDSDHVQSYRASIGRPREEGLVSPDHARSCEVGEMWGTEAGTRLSGAPPDRVPIDDKTDPRLSSVVSGHLLFLEIRMILQWYVFFVKIHGKIFLVDKVFPLPTAEGSIFPFLTQRYRSIIGWYRRFLLQGTNWADIRLIKVE